MDLASGNVELATGSSTASQRPRKLCCFDSTDTVDIIMGESGVASIKPITIPKYYQATFDKMSHKKALCWKDNKDDPWKSLTYGEYKKLIYSVAKSLLKVCAYYTCRMKCSKGCVQLEGMVYKLFTD